MPALRELQYAFMRALRADEPVDTQGLALCDAAGLDVHRHTMRANQAGALRSRHPVVERLVGAEFFAYAAHCFIERYPSGSANLEDYGDGFADFLRGFAPAASLPYLGDVAALEAGIEHIARAADDDASALFHSPYPVLRIWQVNQPGWTGDDGVDLDAGADHLRIHRVRGEVLIEVRDAGPH